MMAKDTNSHGSRFDRAVAVFKNHGGIIHTAQALRSGIHPGTLYNMLDSGVLEIVSRGVYRLADSSPLGNPDLVTVATPCPRPRDLPDLRTGVSRDHHPNTSRGLRRAAERSGGTPPGPPTNQDLSVHR